MTYVQLLQQTISAAGMEAAAADNFSYYGVSRKLETVSIKIWLGLQFATT